MPYSIQGNAANVGIEPQVRNGRTYVPLREVVEALGGQVTWDNQSKQATAQIAQWVATVDAESTQVDVSGTGVTLNGEPFLGEDGRFWVQASFFQTAFGYQVNISGSDISIVNPNA